jgi:O-succinylbenzoic acid--CoA ligase
VDIDWLSADSHVLLNPRMPAEERARLESFVIDLPGHVWLSTSGSTGALKLTALSKEAILASAAAVNRRLEAGSADVWLGVLPLFHVGGLGIHARAFLSGARIATEWSDEVTLAALVPTQVGDLVRSQTRPPGGLRAVVVGGGSLSDDLYRRGTELGWPLLPSYGMTETCSQVATARLGSPELVLLDHAQARVEEDGRLAFRGPSLLTGYGTDAGFVDPKVEGWFVTEDVGSVGSGTVSVMGRRGDFIKIGGELVGLARLDRILEEIAGTRAAVVAVPDERLGSVIHLAVERGSDREAIERAFGARILPYERPRRVHAVDALPRSSLGKLRRGELLRMVLKRGV